MTERLGLPIAIIMFVLALGAISGDTLAGDVTGAIEDNTVEAIINLPIDGEPLANECLVAASPTPDQLGWASCGAGTGVENAYASMTDGTNTSTASGSDTFAFDSANLFLTWEVGDGSPDTATATIDTTQDWPNATTADALAANGANCSAGSAPLGVDEAGAVEGCFDVEEETHATEHQENGADELLVEALGTACTEDQIFVADATGGVECGTDQTGSGGSAITLDLGDDGGNDSTDLTEIATTGDTNNIFTEPSADKLLIDLSNNWPGADAADALSADPANCVTATHFAVGITADGTAECEAISDADVPDDITIDNAGTADALSADPADCAANTYAHTIAADGDLTCSSIDISDDTNLAAGDYLTLTGDTIDADAELYTHAISFVLTDPTDADLALLQWKAPNALTVTEVACSTDTGTATIQLDERTATTPNTGGTDIMTSQLVCDTDQQATTSFDNAGIAAAALISLDVDAVASDPGVVRIHIKFTYDD